MRYNIPTGEEQAWNLLNQIDNSALYYSVVLKFDTLMLYGSRSGLVGL